MLKCLMKYEWVKLRRDTLPVGKGIMGAWAKIAARAAFRKGHAFYCGYKNAVSPGMWSGGIVGLKSILGIKSRVQALEILDKLSDLGYLKYTLDSKTKKLTYQLTDWVVKCSGEECMNGAVYGILFRRTKLGQLQQKIPCSRRIYVGFGSKKKRHLLGCYAELVYCSGYGAIHQTQGSVPMWQITR